MAEVGLPFRSKLWYYRQTNYDSCASDSSYASNGQTALPVSSEWRVARPGAGSDKHVANHSADSPLSNTLWEQTNDYVFHVEYVPQCNDSLLSDVLNRDSEGYLKSLMFVLGVNTSLADTADQSWFQMCGCKPKTITISASTNEKYVVSIDFSVKSILTDGDASFMTDKGDMPGLEPTALSGDYLGFNVAGQIRDGSGSSLADILDSVDITFEHNLSDEYDHDSLNKVKCVEGKYSCTGSFDLSMDEGGAKHWAHVFNQDSFDVDIDLGGSGCPRLQIQNCKWRTHEMTVDTSDEAMKEGCPFTARLHDSGQSVVSDTP